jgi:microcin C transport system ATP-binding protein
MTDVRPVLEIEHLRVSFTHAGKRLTAVDDVSFSIAKGRTLALVGASGSGKSVTAHALLGLLPEKATTLSGTIRHEGYALQGLTAEGIRALRGRRISMIFQEPMTALNPLHRVGEQIREMIAVHGGDASTQRVEHLLAQVELPEPATTAGKYPHELSGGQRQRVMIAMAIANHPSLLIADEPTTALDVTVQKQILDLLRKLQSETGMALLLITHDLGIVRHYADDVAVLEAGRLVEYGSVATVFESPAHDCTRSLLESEPRPLTAVLSQPTEPLLAVKKLRVAFPIRSGFLKRTVGHFVAADDVSFTLSKGRTLGIVGESGSGKTTIAQAILKLIPFSGEVFIGDVDIAPLNPKAMLPFRRQIQIVFQDPFASLSPRMSVGQIISEGLLVHQSLSPDIIRNMVAEAMNDVGLDPAMIERYPHEFSGGQRQRIAIARALVLKPKILVLDEPTSALDKAVQAQVVNLLKTLQARLGLSYIFISHDLKLVRYMADEILVMHHGKVVEQGDAETVFTAPREDYTRKLLAAVL